MQHKLRNIVLGATMTLVMVNPTRAHHYKGLPHYNYFDNYPQVPILEFIEERDDYSVFVTIYNFQGLDLDMVEAPDDVRFYIYLYDMGKDGAYIGDADFNIYSHDKLIKRYINIKQEEERIYNIRATLLEQDDLILEAIMTDINGKKVSVKVPIKIAESFLDKYGLYIAIVAFFVAVGVLKTVADKRKKKKSDK